MALTEVERRWRPAPIPDALADLFERAGQPPPKRYIIGPTDKPFGNAIVAREEVAKDDMRWHISVSRPDRMPKWDDVVAVAHQVRPGVCFVIGVPPRSWWINVHPFCLHLWECHDPHLVDQWREEGRQAGGQRPT